MFKAIFFLFIFNWAFFSKAQESIKKFVQSQCIPILHIQPDSTDFNDLEAIGNAIGNAKIVMLGEQDHGDAPTFLAKTRLIKYLHEKKGFNVVAFESDFFGLNFGWNELTKTPENISKFIKQNIFPIWTGCNTCRPLFNEYIPNTYKTSNPIIVTGFDNQLILNYSSKYLTAKLDSVLQSLKLPITKKENYQSEILPTIDSMKQWYLNPPKDTTLYSKCWQYLNEIKIQAAPYLNSNSFWSKVIENLLQEYLSIRSSQKEYRFAMNVRDEQMAENLKWLSQNKFPNEKIIVWAANYHIAKYTDTATSNIEKRIITMGSFFTKDSFFQKSTYIIGFSSYSGEAGRLGYKNYKINKPKLNSFETWVNEKYDYAFIDFKNNNNNLKSEKFLLKGFGHHDFKTNWNYVFDGIFYIKNMYPCEKK